jgi:uncharacterized membrane protein YkoI
MTTRWFALAGVALAVTGAALSAQKMQMKDLPPAVQNGVQDNLKGAALKGVAKEVEGGKTQYEVESTLNGKARDFLLDAKGTLIELEEELAVDAVPAPVRITLEARGKILKVELLTRGKSATYEAQVEKDGKKSAVEVAADGTLVKPKK